MLCTYQLHAPPSPLRQWVGRGGDLNNQKFKCPTVWESHCNQIPSYPLHLEAIRWGFDQTKGKIPHSTGAYFVFISTKSNPHPSPPTVVRLLSFFCVGVRVWELYSTHIRGNHPAVKPGNNVWKAASLSWCCHPCRKITKKIKNENWK